MKKNECCPLCNSKKYFMLERINVSKIIKEYSSKIKVRHFFGELKEIKRLECIDCGLIFFDYIIEGDSEYYAKISAGDKYYSTQKWDFNKALDLIKKYRPDSLLEIGCANGYFLEKLQHIVNEIAGNELNKSALEKCTKKGIKIIDLDNKNEYGKYDMIVTFQVFEHINDADGMIKRVHNLLKEGGIFILAVPNPHGYLGTTWDFLNLPPHHPLWWTKESFESLKKYNIEMIDYFEESLSYWSFLHYIYYGQDLPQGRLMNLFAKLQKIRLYFRGPSIFDERKFIVKGHTHIGVFKKNGNI
ncbi:MAG: class I SAM-dependent methyltransferase [Candidatus Absconditabacterales bacterium]